MGSVSTGITITFNSGFFAEILDVSPPGATREWLKISHQGTTGAHEFTPAKLVDWGECGVELQFDPDTKPPMNDAAETVTITFANGATWAFSGGLSGFEPTAAFEDVMKATATLKVASDVTVVAGS